MTHNTDTAYMHRCLQLARNGLGQVSTNPLVGCVIVCNGVIIGEGYHHRYGEAHAEVNAINSVKDKNLLSQSILYVNLEPCAHYGKTPPCANLIVEHNVKRVVIGTVDTYSQVAGKGVEKLKSAGIEVVVGVLEEECRYLNRRFFCFNEKKRPYIVLKWAQTANGLIGRTADNNQLDKKISNRHTNVLVHKWRTEEDAILVGKNTALYDNPLLTARLWEGRNPVRVLIDLRLEVPLHYHIFNDQARTIVFNATKQETAGNIRYEKIDFSGGGVSAFLQRLYELNIQSVLVEGGKYTLETFINAGLWDEARVINTGKYWPAGVAAPFVKGAVVHKEVIETDTVTYLQPE